MKSFLTVSLLLSIFLGLNLTIKAQNTNDFLLCDSAFLVTVNELIISNFDSKRDAKRYVETFTKAWKSDFFSSEMQFDICEISHNLMIRRQVAFQSYKLYLDLLISFSQKSEQRQNYQIFNYLMKEYCNNSGRSVTFISEYIQKVKSLIEGNFLFDNPQTRWKSTVENYEFTITDDEHLEVNFPTCNLICYAQNDSIVIYNTEGKYSFKDLIFRGERGKVSWERAGYNADSMYAVFGRYNMELTRSLLVVDTVELYNYVYFEEPIFGRLRYQAEKINTPAEARFPKFESFQKRFTLSELYPKVDYTGGYVQHGSRFIGSGTKDEPAILDFWREFDEVVNGDTVQTMKVALRSMSEEYTFTKDKVYSDYAIISIYLDQDSIYHPGLKMQFFVQPREVYLVQDNDLANMSRAPYYDSYHMVEFRADLLTWKLDQHNINFTRMLGTQSSKAIFESYNYFASDRFFKLQGIDNQHPLFQIREFVQKRGNETFTAVELGAFMRYSESKMRQLLALLSFEGYVYYDRQTYTATVRPKLYESCLAATNQKDYDVVAIESEMDGRNPNAVLNLKNYDINIFGIKSFPFSKTNRIIAFPQNGAITLQRDRNILFAGMLRAGLYSFIGKRFVFNYQQFKVDLEEVGKMLLDVVTGMKSDGEYIVQRVNNSIQDIKGYIQIDNPKNKSSRYFISKYPIFESTKNSYVYYDHLFNGEYHRDSVYFLIDPFVVDSINNPQAERVKLTGEFYSGNIFPVFRENLTIQKDLSLGFIHKLPEAGFSTYGGIGTSLGTIEVANSGIKMRGQLDYRRTSTWSDDFTFFPDSMLSQSKRFLNRSSSEPSLPLIDGKDIYVRWMPYQDRIIGKTTTTPVDMFNAQASLSGTFEVKPDEATGSGEMAIQRSKLLSKEFVYTENTISAQNSEWNLHTKDGTSLAFESRNLNSFIDFTQRKGTFTSNSSDNIMTFPVNQYIAYADQVVWNIDHENLAIATEKVHSFEDQKHKVLAAPTTENPSGSLLVSIHPRQDSLNFISPIAYIDLSKNIISAQKVGFVNIADASILPSDSTITINADAQHKTLSNAVILANRQTKYHRIYNASVNILGRKMYSANGWLDYVDVDRNRQIIKLEVITVNKETNTTYGTGRIVEEADFTLSPAFRYKGDVKLFASNPYLYFQGFAKMKWLPNGYQAHWIKFASEINPSMVMIPVDTINQNEQNSHLIHSLVTNMDSIKTYVRFFHAPERPNYHVYTNTAGFLTFNPQEKKYEVGSYEKITNRSTKDNFMSLNSINGNYYAEGKIRMVRTLDLVELASYGNINFDKQKNEILFSTFMVFDFFFNEQNLVRMADTINTIEELLPIQFNNTIYVLGMSKTIGDSAFNRLMEQTQLFAKPKELPEEYKHSIILSNVNLKWDAEDYAYKSFGPIGVSNFLDRPVNKTMKGAVEIRYIKQKPEVMIYLEPTPNLWYFFVYKQNSLLTVSSDPTYNQMIEKIKLKHRSISSGKQKYTYYLTYPRIKDETLFYYGGGKRDDKNQKNKKR